MTGRRTDGEFVELQPVSWDRQRTPDRFSGDGLLGRESDAVANAITAEAEGADIIDIGGQSTRPGHVPVSEDEEYRRVIPVVREIVRHVSIPISIDTSSAKVAEAAIDAGATMINDVRGLMADPELAPVVARAGVPVVVMHDKGADEQGDLITSIVRELSRRLDYAVEAGMNWQI
ncbi:MAG: dihydropteroate synthase [Thermomicrobiales bacterium]